MAGKRKTKNLTEHPEYNKAKECIYKEDFFTAKQILEKIYTIDSKNEEIIANLIICCFRSGQYSMAVKYAKEILNSKRYRMNAWYAIFYSYINMNKPQQAYTFLRMNIDPVPFSSLTGSQQDDRIYLKKDAQSLFNKYILPKSLFPEFTSEEYDFLYIRKYKKIEIDLFKEQNENTKKAPPKKKKKNIKQAKKSKSKPVITPVKKPAAKVKQEPEKAPKEPVDKLKLAKSGITEISPIKIPDIKFSFTFNAGKIPELIKRGKFEDINIYDTRLEGERILLLRGFDQLICLNTLQGVEHYWYQVETVKKVLKYFRGRSLLCDEVGLGKTIEAGMILKEYILRGLAKKVLILAPPSLVPQWQVELEEKFGLQFTTTLSGEYQADPGNFWRNNSHIIASIATARSKKNFENVTSNQYDLIIVDEAHHVKNSRTVAWKMINSLKKKFILLLTATPVQNDLMELYNLITLLSPGTLRTSTQFKKEFVKKGDLRSPKNMDKLRELLSSVMIRNTRAMVDINLPPRYASTYRFQQKESEKELYEDILEIAHLIEKEHKGSKMLIMTLLSEAGSSPWALSGTLEKLVEKKRYPMIQKQVENIYRKCIKTETTGKVDALLDILKKSGEKKIIFTKYRGTLDYLQKRMEKEKISTAVFHGGLTSIEKEKQLDFFEHEASILITTEVGGEGRNLQFCSTMINFDLPWNPMQIEQRIGRIHRIGQEKDVYIFNISQKGTIEDYIISVLDSKINMFQLVIGEIGMILGNLDAEKEFPDIIMDLWSKSGTSKELEENFNKLGDDLVKAKEEYLQTRELDDTLFSEDYEV